MEMETIEIAHYSYCVLFIGAVLLSLPQRKENME